MRTKVEFRSEKFPAQPGEDINPGLWGKSLAEYLSRELQALGIEVGEIDPEDWGWRISLQRTPFPMWIGCGHYQEYPDGYLVFIEPSKPVIRQGLLKKIDTTAEVSRIADALDKILGSDPDIHQVRWWDEQEK
jgi:hypothetical protein